MLLGPIFIPMLYMVNPAMTPDLVAAAFRVADSATNIITHNDELRGGFILAFMRKYNPKLSFGEMIAMMLPVLDASVSMVVWSILLVLVSLSFGIHWVFLGCT